MDIPMTNLGRNFCRHSTLFFLGVFGHFQNPHLNFTSVWWQVGRSMSRPFEPDPLPEHARATSYTPPSHSLYNVHRALMPLFLGLFLCIFVSASSSSGARLSTAVPERRSLLTKRSISYSRGDLHGGGVGVAAGPRNKKLHFKIQNFHLKSPLPICSHKRYRTHTHTAEADGEFFGIGHVSFYISALRSLQNLGLSSQACCIVHARGALKHTDARTRTHTHTHKLDLVPHATCHGAFEEEQACPR